MTTSRSDHALPDVSVTFGAALWLVGLGALFVVYGVLSHRVVNVVTYELSDAAVAPAWLAYWAPCVGAAAAALLAILHRFGPARPKGVQVAEPSAARAGLPLVLMLAVTGLWLTGSAPTYLTVCLALVGFVWSISRLGQGVVPPLRRRRVDRYAPALLAIAILASTIWHAAEQARLWRSFMFGYADFGFFVTELEHCLPWKEVGPGRFADTRMGYHCIWMFYLLAPFYALVRSPVFLMFVGPLALNLAAAPFYQLARDRTGSRVVGLLVGLAWLALSSVSRLPYSNTYGFQSIYLAVPWLAWAFTLGARGHWRWSYLCLAGALLCEETACGVAFGWGVYLMLWGGRQRDGLWVVVLTAAYLWLCTAVVIPFFAPSGQYTRLGLFGYVTGGDIIDRVLRPRVAFYVLALTAPLVPGLLRGWKVLIAAVPTLLLVALFREADYLNIKYWHQSSVLPVLFLAATMGVTYAARSQAGGAPARGAVGPALGLLVGALLFHQLTGLSPLTRSYQFAAQQRALHDRDPRTVAVDYVRKHFPPERTAVIATERMAAHFTDYRTVRPARDADWPRPTQTPHVLVVDRSDGWDPMIRSGRVEALLKRARAAGFTPVHEEGSVLVLARGADRAPEE